MLLLHKLAHEIVADQWSEVGIAHSGVLGLRDVDVFILVFLVVLLLLLEVCVFLLGFLLFLFGLSSFTLLSLLLECLLLPLSLSLLLALPDHLSSLGSPGPDLRLTLTLLSDLLLRQLFSLKPLDYLILLIDVLTLVSFMIVVTALKPAVLVKALTV